MASSRKPEKLQPKTELWLLSEKMPMPTAKTKNKHRGSSFRDFLKSDGLLEEVEATALKRALAMKVADLMRKRDLNKSTMAAQMRTSRAAVHRPRSGKYIDHACDAQPRREIARAQSEDRAGARLNLPSLPRRSPQAGGGLVPARFKARASQLSTRRRDRSLSHRRLSVAASHPGS